MKLHDIAFIMHEITWSYMILLLSCMKLHDITFSACYGKLNIDVMDWVK